MQCGQLVGLVDGLYQVVSDEVVDTPPNIIVNPGFELGISPWAHTSGIATDIVLSGTSHTGFYSGNFTFGESSPQRCYQNLIANKASMQGKACSFKIWLRLTHRTTPAIKIYVQSNFGPNVESPLINGNDTWQQYTLNFTGNFDSGGTTTYINVGVVSYVDNVYPVRADDAQLIITPGVTQVQVDGLGGEADNHYKVIGRIVGSGAANYLLRINADSGPNYGYQEIKTDQSPAYVASRVQDTNGMLVANGATGQISFFEADVYAHTGGVRTVLANSISGVVGNTIGGGRITAGVWSNTATALTSIEVVSSVSYGLGLGSRVMVLRKVELDEGTEIGSLESPVSISGVWQLVGSQAMVTNQNSVQFTGLDGNAAAIYKITAVARSVVGDPTTYRLQFGPGVGDSRCVDFFSYKGGSPDKNVVALNELIITRDYYGNQGQLAEVTIYAASGANRVYFSRYSWGSGGVYGSGLVVGTWNNTVDNIQTITIEGSFGVGSVIELWKLNIG